MVGKYGLICTASLLALTHAVPAVAQDGDADGLNEIIVTAQKREQTLAEVPMAISVVGAEELGERGIEDVQDLSFAVPGLTMREDGPGSYTIFLRGLANQSGSGALVTQYLDEAPLSLSGYDQLSPVPLDLERVEVLKGPQGTLYGQGSAGGTIRYITKAPDPSEIEGRVEGKLYSVAHGEAGVGLTGVFNLPLVQDELALRVAGRYEAGGGWIDQPQAGITNGNGTELINVRAKLRWSPSELFEATGMVQVHRADTDLGLGFEEPDRAVDIGPDRSKVMIPKKFDFTLYNLELRYDLGFAELVSATTYVEHDHQYPFTYIPRPGNYSYGIVEGNDDRWVDADQFSQELRLASGDGPFQWTLGAFYTTSDRTLTAEYEYAYAPDGDLYSGGGFLVDDLYYFSGSTSETVSVFADAAYDVTDRLTLGAGIRYFRDEQSSLITYVPDTGSEMEATFDSVDPRVYLSYRYAREANFYASFAKGFRSGGFNSEPFDPYDPEKIYTYEIGTKGAALDGRLQFELAAFYTEYEDMIRRRLTEVDGAFLGESSNIGKVEVKGIELGLAAKPIAGLTLSATGAYIDSEIVETAETDQVNVPGDPTDYTPEISYTLGANYDFDWTNGVPGFVRIDYNYRDAVTYIDRSSFLPSALPQRSDSIGLLNARIGATIGGLDLAVFAQNITDENKAIDPYQGWANSNRTRPRVVGVELGISF